jgi:hypothetical protein
LEAGSEGADIEAASGEEETMLGTDAQELEAVVMDAADSVAPDQAEAEA